MKQLKKKKKRNIVIWHFQFYDAIKKQPTNVGLFNDAGTYQMSLGFHKVRRLWLGSGMLARPIFGAQKTVE